jgi:hypothetical protein
MNTRNPSTPNQKYEKREKTDQKIANPSENKEVPKMTSITRYVQISKMFFPSAYANT